MGSNQLVDHTDHGSNSFSFAGDYGHGRSTAQMCLSKILRIISSLPPNSTSSSSSSPYSSSDPALRRVSKDGFLHPGKRGLDIDLNVLFSSSPEAGTFESPTGVSDTIADKSSEEVDRCDSKGFSELCGSNSAGIEEIEQKEEKKSKALEEKSSGSESTTIEETRGDGCFGLLIEAAKLILGSSGDGEFEPSESGSRSRLLRPDEVLKQDDAVLTGNRGTAAYEPATKKQKQNTCFASSRLSGENEPAAAARSKRERTRVRPYKYRDSILEPLTPYSLRTRSAMGSTKRRSR